MSITSEAWESFGAASCTRSRKRSSQVGPSNDKQAPSSGTLLSRRRKVGASLTKRTSRPRPAASATRLVRARSRICRSDARFSRNADVRTAGYHDARPMTNTNPPEHDDHDEVTPDGRVELLVGRPQEEIA